MSVEVSADIAKKNLEDTLAKLSPEETATLIGPEGKPMAVLVPLKSSKEKVEEIDWDAQWEDLAGKIDSAWKSEKSTLEILTETRG